MKIGRNDACMCGSGKKYKKCCMNKNPELIWSENFDRLDIRSEKRAQIKDVLFYSYDFMKKNEWQGACHALSTIQYVVLNELGVNPKLCLGIVEGNGIRFDHSWIEIEGKIYDITVANGLDGVKVSEPIMAGVSIDTLERTKLTYGMEGIFDYEADMIKNLSITEYLDGFSSIPKDNLPQGLRNGLWKVIENIANRVGLELEEEYLRSKYSDIKTTVV